MSIKLSIYLVIIIFCSTLLFFCNGKSKSSQEISIKVTRLSPKVIILNCLQTNIIAISSSEGLIIIDTHRSPGLMSLLKKEIESDFGRDDYLYVINTHGHWDHCSGNQVFSETTIIGHRFCPEYMRNFPANSIRNLVYAKKYLEKINEKLETLDSNEPEYNEIISEMKAKEMLFSDLNNNYVLTPPSKTFKDSLTINLEDMTLKLFYCGTNHTNNDIFVHVPEEKLVATGDLFISNRHFGFSFNQMADMSKLVETINKITKNDKHIEFVIPAHTEILTREDLLSLRDLLLKKSSEQKNIKSAARAMENLIEEYGIESALKKFENIKMNNSDLHFSEKEFDILGYRLRGMGKIGAAIEILKLNINNNPNSSNAYDSLAEAYLSQGDLNLAMKYYTKSLKLFPLNENASAMINKIREINNGIF